MSVTTVQLLADKAFQGTAGQSCVDWAIGMLQQGYESDSLLRLAGMMPPYNHFEISGLRDRAFEELSIRDLAPDEAALQYATQVLSDALIGNKSLISAFEIAKNMCIACGYEKKLMGFYLLFFAYTDLRESDLQWYWADADQENIDGIMRERATTFVESQKRNGLLPSF